MVEPDEELGGYTVAVNEIDLYGEGNTYEEAVNDLIDSIQEYLAIYVKQIELISKAETREKNLYLLKLLRCNNDREEIRKALGLQ
ncbi:MAG: hypothetical protein QHH10_10565 [Peptococcaceae bacterium]|nr:hypothetical protein [Peptococcaceae bacterium]MDH7525740.1 hypothetical protein [Peptococcaceae bacterium]